MVRRRFAFVCLLFLCPIVLRGEDPSRAAKGLAAMMQSMNVLQGYIAGGEFTAIHNEDSVLSDAIEVLGHEPGIPEARRAEAASTLAQFKRELADLHEVADEAGIAEIKPRFRKLSATYAQIKSFFDARTLAVAKTISETYTCPMHRDVVGKIGTRCPKCGMPLDEPVRVKLLFFDSGSVDRSVRASIATGGPLQAGREVKGVLQLDKVEGGPVLPTDLRVVHTERIHLLIVDPSLVDYHHVHPQPTPTPGKYAFSFTPRRPGPYRAWADVRTTYRGSQEYAMADMTAAAKPLPIEDRRMMLEARVDGLRYTLTLERPTIVVGEPIRARLHIADRSGLPFRRLEPIMAAFAHLVAFNEDYRTVLHLHPLAAQPLRAADRGGPDLEFQIYATKPGFYRLFAQVQIGGASKFAPFGLSVAASPAAKTTP